MIEREIKILLADKINFRNKLIKDMQPLLDDVHYFDEDDDYIEEMMFIANNLGKRL